MMHQCPSCHSFNTVLMGFENGAEVPFCDDCGERFNLVMQTPEYCPNCGSFDLIIHPETDEEYRWCECLSCVSSWSEDDGMGDPDGEDDTPLGNDGYPVDMPDDIKAWLAGNH